MNQPSCTAMRCMMTAIALFTVAALLQLSLKAQNTYGSIIGTVTDASDAVVPDAAVTVTDIGTGQVLKTQADAGGKYSVQDLPPADYKVVVEKASFKRIDRERVSVEVGAVVRIDFSLAIGNANETVEVTASTPLLQTDTSSLSQQVEGDVVQQMPLNGRNVMNLIELAPGVVPAGGASGSTGLDLQNGRTGGGFGWNNFEIGGAIQGQSEDYIDGVPNQLLGGNIVALVPTQDAVQEFNVVSSNATADYGRFAGGVVNMSTKSGSNAFHGTAYEYLRNADFNANTWFNNHNGLPVVKWNQNQYGAAASGPIKRDKAFFLVTWENFKILSQQINSTTVPTAAMQNGVIPEHYSNGVLIPVQDPLGNCNIAHQAGTAAAPGTWTITNLYAAGVKSGTCGDPLNEVLKQYYPLPNVVGTGYNWIQNTPFTDNQTQYNGRVDYALTPKQRLFARYTWWKTQDSHNSTFGDHGSPAFGSTTPTTWPTAMSAPFYRTQQAVLGDAYTLNPTTVFDIRAGYTRQVTASAIEDSSVDESQYDQYNPNKYYTALAPQMNIHSIAVDNLSGVDGLYGFHYNANFNGNWYNTYSLNASLVKILGAHNLKVGVEARLMDNSGTPYVGESGGFYNYDTAFTGDEFAEFLIGYPSGGTAVQFQNYATTAAYSYYQGYYVMDDWQVTRKLTLNIGLRYELPGGTAERNNKLSVLLPHAVDPYTGITGTEGLVNSPLYHPRTDVVEKYDLFAPRVGFAYRATSNTVLHGGYGISYLPDDLAGINGFGTLPFQSPFNSVYTTVGIAEAGTAQPLQTVLGGVVTGGLHQASPKPPANFMTAYGSSTKYLAQTLQAPVPYQSYPYVQQWNLGMSHQFKGDFMAEISYAGLKGTNLPEIGAAPNYFGLDELGSQYYSMGAAALSATSTSTTGCANAPALVGQISVGQCLRPNPFYADMQDTARYTGRQNYKSLLINTEKRFGSGGVLNANYSWSKNMADTDTQNQQLEATAAPHVDKGEGAPQDYNNIAGEYSLISYDVTNRFVLDYELPLPFGKGKKYGNNLNGVANALASGWAVNGITIFQSGFPTFISSAASNLLTGDWGAGALRPNVVPGCNKKVSGGSQARVLAGAWFNTACFVYPSSSYDPAGKVSFGDEPRVDPDLRADGIKNFDFAFQKSTPIFESSSFVFRAEFFNIMNRVQYAPPVNTQGTASFGAIISQVNNPRQIQLSARITF